MTITPEALYPPSPLTTRGHTTRLSYDAKNDRIAYPSGKSVFVRPADPQSVSPVIQFSKHIYKVTTVEFAPTGNYIASGDEYGNVKIWDTSIKSDSANSFEQPTVKSEFQVLSGPVKSIAWDADSQRIIAVGEGKEKFGHCFTWDSGNSIGEIQGHSDSINAVSIKPQRPYRAATVSNDKALVFYQGPPFKFDKSIRGKHTNTIRDVKFSPDGKYIVSVGSDRIIVLYDGKTGDFIKKIENAHEGGIFGVSWRSDSSTFVTCSADNSLKEWDPESDNAVKTYKVNDKTTIEDQLLSVVVTSKYIISLSTNGDLNFIDSTEGPTKIIGVQPAITCTGYKSQEIIVGSANGKLIQIPFQNGQFAAQPVALGSTDSTHTNYISGIITLESSIISSGWDDTLKVWKNGQLELSIDLKAQPKKISLIGEDIFVLFENSFDIYTRKLERIVSEKFTYNATNATTYANKIFITNSNVNTVEEYNLSGTEISKGKTSPALRAAPSLIKISPDGKFMAVADTFGKYIVYNTDDFTVVTSRWAFHSAKVLDAQWSPDSKFLVSAGLDTAIYVYSVARPAKVLKFLLAHQLGVSGLQWTSYDEDKKSARFISTGLDGVVKSWNADLSAY